MEAFLIIDGKKIAAEIETQLKQASLKIQGRKPALAFVLVGKDPASIAYIKRKKKKCQEVGILSIDHELSDSTTEDQLLILIQKLNEDKTVDGILVQLPLPSHIHTEKILESIDPKKDVDGFHPLNVGRLLIGEKTGFFPCTPYGITILLKHAGIDTSGKHVVIVGRSNIVGKPLAALLMQKAEGANATVTVAHSQTKNLETICRSADILIAAIGKSHFVTADMVKEGATVIDVGINKLDDKLVGDVDFESVAPKCQAISPVPGGVGPMTIAMLLSNTLLAYQRYQK
ncbi:MAG: bifunctional methylenetetrahydrofolate dehydrogenase/methenyltetrahydrofolate cyclohydrolase FolD [Simkaniaceae bacterium]|nr:bifunctional methylenetetrahydrofolate dehydrogenase/methenyltetrahydrofolate cyclohydrolase FolD [Candidatus Sacchlamyda saccharinae]